MKYLLSMLLAILLVRTSYADTTYEKVSENIVKITNTETIVTSDNKTIAFIKEEIARKDLQIANLEQGIIELKVEKTELEQEIVEAEKLGISEAKLKIQ